MRRLTLAILVLLPLASCEAVVGDYEVAACNPDPPASCADLGELPDQQIGCCNGDANMVWFCQDGALFGQSCGELTCDYDPDIEAMGCVD